MKWTWNQSSHHLQVKVQCILCRIFSLVLGFFQHMVYVLFTCSTFCVVSTVYIWVMLVAIFLKCTLNNFISFFRKFCWAKSFAETIPQGSHQSVLYLVSVNVTLNYDVPKCCTSYKLQVSLFHEAAWFPGVKCQSWIFSLFQDLHKMSGVCSTYAQTSLLDSKHSLNWKYQFLAAVASAYKEEHLVVNSYLNAMTTPKVALILKKLLFILSRLQKLFLCVYKGEPWVRINYSYSCNASTVTNSHNPLMKPLGFGSDVIWCWTHIQSYLGRSYRDSFWQSFAKFYLICTCHVSGSTDRCVKLEIQWNFMKWSEFYFWHHTSSRRAKKKNQF